jgi:hypothetical protein
MSAGASGLLKPCISSQLLSRRKATCSSVSTPSAMTFSFSFWPNEITALATALSFSFVPRSLMNDLSIFSRATGNVFSELRLE